MSADAIVSTGLAYAGLSYGSDADAYDRLLFAASTPAAARQMGRSDSSCGLFVRAVCAKAEVDGTIDFDGRTLDVLREPYERLSGQAIALPIALARARGLWKSNPTGDDLQPGVVVYVQGPEHVAICTGRTVAEDGTVTLEFVQGGGSDPQNIPYDTMIHVNTHPLQHGGGRLVLGGRVVGGCFDAGALPCRSDSDEPPPTLPGGS